MQDIAVAAVARKGVTLPDRNHDADPAAHRVDFRGLGKVGNGGNECVNEYIGILFTIECYATPIRLVAADRRITLDFVRLTTICPRATFFPNRSAQK